jgi:imidazolonepropionase-like amidohydrolase
VIDLDGPWFDELVQALSVNNVTVDPTLVILQTLAFGDDLSVLEKLEPQLAPSTIHDTWGENWQTGNPYALNGPQQPTTGKALFPIAQEIVRRFHERGVRLAVGTDVGMPWITPGVSFHREMELLVESGIAPADVLVLATRNGAKTIRADDERGTIEPGKLADLIVLGKSPLEDIRNTRSIEAVYKGGKLFDPGL